MRALVLAADVSLLLKGEGQERTREQHKNQSARAHFTRDDTSPHVVMETLSAGQERH